MAVLVVAAAGAYVGSVVGIGAAAGWVIGSYLYSSFLAPGQKKNVRTSELNDLRVMGTEYGQPIPYIIGTMAVAGDMWWNSDRRPVVTTTTTESGGKGGGGGTETTTTVTTYDMDALVGLCDNRIAGIWRIWDEGKLIWSQHPESPPSSIDASEEVITWDRMTIYTGDPSQMPDPTYEAAVGIGSAPAYRHRAYVFFEGLHLGQSGRVPNFTFEIITDGEWVGPSALDAAWIEVGALPSLIIDRPITDDFYVSPYVKGASDSRIVTFPEVKHPTTVIAGGKTRFYQIVKPGNSPSDWSNTNLSAVWETATGAHQVAYTSFSGGGFVAAGKATQVAQVSDYVGGVYTWTPSTNFAGTDYWDMAVSEVTQDILAIAFATSGGSSAKVSINGIFWTDRPQVTGVVEQDITADDDGRYFLLSYERVYVSYNSGQTWNDSPDLPGTPRWFRICYTGGGHLVCLSNWHPYDSLDVICTSDDYGLTWTPREASQFCENGWQAIASDGAGFVVVVGQGGNTSVDCSMCSFDHGETWHALTTSVPIWFRNVTYGGDRRFYSLANNRELAATENAPGRRWGMVLPIPDPPGDAHLESETVTVEEAVRRLLVRCGMVEGTQFDVSALASITKPVRALYISQVSPTRQTIDALASTYFFDMVVSDKLYCRPRGGAIAATIPYEDLGAAFDGSSDELDQFILKNSGDLEFPARVSLVYRNVMHEYMVDTQTSDRLVSASADTAKVITLPLCFTPGEAKQCADVMLFNQAVNMLSVDSIKVLGDYVALEPTDAVNVFDAQGNTYRMRLTSRRDEYPLLEYSAVLDDVAILASSAVTDENYEESFIVEAVPLTVDLLLDIPMLRDVDTDLGMYAVAKGATNAKWPGCVIYVSGDDVNYDSVGGIAYPNVFGICQTTLGNWPRGRLIDEANSVTVNIGPGASLSSSTYERVLNNETINACVVGDELLQFIDATATADGVYVLSRLLRGSQGTERVMAAHTADERFALLDPGRLGRVVTPNNLLGAPLDYKFVTVGRTLESDTPETVTNTGVNLMPISPVYLQVYRDPANNDATITWERRSRFAVRVLGPRGIDVPPDEVGWEVDVFSSGAYATKVRTITAPVAARPSAHYYAAEQSADGLTPGAPLFLRIYPMSGNIGRGFPLTASM